MDIFVKLNSLDNDSIIKEVKGLSLLEKTLEDTNNNYLKIPKIIDFNEKELKLQKIIQAVPSSSQINSLAVGLSKLHQIEFQEYGFKEDNYIGQNPQKNTMSKNWGEFFFEYRLLYQINMIQEENIKNSIFLNLNTKREVIIELLNENTKFASLVHGDLWSGNVIFDKENVYLIDPAVYYADREVDIAMMELFGGFPDLFYKKYNENLQFSKKYESKKLIYNLYHFINHYNLFGKTYLSSIYNSLDKIQKM